MAATPLHASEAPTLRARIAGAAREGGLPDLLWGALAVTVFRRLTIYARHLAEPADEPALARLAVRPVSDTVQYRALRPGASGAEVERRLAAGDVCAGAWLDGRLVAVRWLSLARAEMAYLDLVFDLPPGCAYNYDAFTDPSARGAGINTALSVWIGAWLRERGTTSLVTAILPENRGGRGIAAHVPTQPVGWVGCLRFAGRRRAVRRVPPGVLGAAARRSR